MSEHKVIPLKGGDRLRIKVRYRKKLPYDKIVSLLRLSESLFIPDLDRRKNSVLKKVLRERYGLDIESDPADFESEEGIQKGYVVYLKGTKIGNTI